MLNFGGLGFRIYVRPPLNMTVALSKPGVRREADCFPDPLPGGLRRLLPVAARAEPGHRAVLDHCRV